MSAPSLKGKISRVVGCTFFGVFLEPRDLLAHLSEVALLLPTYYNILLSIILIKKNNQKYYSLLEVSKFHIESTFD